MAAVRQRVGPVKDFYVRLSTGKWEYLLEPVDGLTFLINKDDKFQGTVYIKPCAESKARLDTIIHETLHASNPEMSEEDVVRIAGDVTAVLWAAGYRRLT